MPDPLAYLLSWTTYATWLHGAEKGSVQKGVPGIQAPDPEAEEQIRRGLPEPPFVMNDEQRRIVEQAIVDHCAIRGWTLHALNVRTNHVHVVVTASCRPEKVMQELKSWATRRLKPTVRRKRYWTEHGSTKWINDQPYLRNAIIYVRDKQ
jgi:REP element-mobilizing transposase RayT